MLNSVRKEMAFLYGNCLSVYPGTNRGTIQTSVFLGVVVVQKGTTWLDNKMVKQFWINLPVKNIENSKDFFTKLGFSFKTEYGTPNSACLLLGESNVVCMLLEEQTFKGIINHEITNIL